MKEKKKWWKITSVILNVIFYVFIAVLFIFSIANLSVKTEADFPTLFGKGFFNVVSPSMVGENKDSFDPGDLLIVDKLSDKEKENLKVGDVVTWFDFDIALADGTTMKGFNTHRIVAIVDANDAEGVSQRFYILQGDNKTGFPVAYNPDKSMQENDLDGVNFDQVAASSVLGRYSGKVTNLGNAIAFLQTPAGFGICIALPTLLFLVVQVCLLVINVSKYNKEKNKLTDDEQKELLRQQILEELKKEQEQKEEQNN